MSLVHSGPQEAVIPTAQVADASSPSEREAFENWYCRDAAACGVNILPSEMVPLRNGDNYGDRLALNSKWEGWQGRSLIQEKSSDLAGFVSDVAASDVTSEDVNRCQIEVLYGRILSKKDRQEISQTLGVLRAILERARA